MRNLLAICASLISVIFTVPYIVGTLKGSIRPNIVSWFTWTLLSSISGYAALKGGGIQTAIFGFIGAGCTAAITIAGLKHGVRRYTKFDVVCQILALVGIALWRLTHQPAAAITVNMLADFIAFLPTLRHAWLKPYEETWQVFAGSSLSAALIALLASKLTYVALAFPIYLCFANLSVIIVIYKRRSKRSLQQ